MRSPSSRSEGEPREYVPSLPERNAPVLPSYGRRWRSWHLPLGVTERTRIGDHVKTRILPPQSSQLVIEFIVLILQVWVPDPTLSAGARLRRPLPGLQRGRPPAALGRRARVPGRQDPRRVEARRDPGLLRARRVRLVLRLVRQGLIRPESTRPRVPLPHVLVASKRALIKSPNASAPAIIVGIEITLAQKTLASHSSTAAGFQLP